MQGMPFRKPLIIQDYFSIGKNIKLEATTVAYFSAQTYFFKHKSHKSYFWVGIVSNYARKVRLY